MQAEQEQPTFGYCAIHSDVETGLSCTRCGKYICPRCMVQTPVGARCRDCGRVQRSPVFDVSSGQYAIASAVAIGVGAVAGVAWGVLLGIIGWIFFLPWLLAMGVGYIIGEAVSASVNRKRGTGLAIVVAVGVIVAFIPAFVIGRNFNTPNLVFALLFLGVAIYIAVNRVR